MGKLDTKFNNLVPRLLGKFRTTTDQLIDDETTEDFATGENIPAFLGPWTVTASPAFNYTEREIDGEQIKRGDKRIIIAAKNLTTTPDPQKHKYLKGGVTYEVITVKQIEAGDSVVAYKLQLRV